VFLYLIISPETPTMCLSLIAFSHVASFAVRTLIGMWGRGASEGECMRPLVFVAVHLRVVRAASRHG
jgi:hypothetical protein